MVRMNAVPRETAKRWAEMELPAVEPGAWTQPAKPVTEAKVALVSSAGMHLKSDRPFARDPSYRVIPSDTKPDDLFMSHVSPNFDRTAFQEDINVSFPIERLRELADEGVIGSVATNHYSFMGATDPTTMEDNVKEVAGRLHEDGVDLILLSGV